jgi:hypothetical protein
VLGVGLGMGLYDPAFATLTWLYGREARSAITRDYPDRRVCQHDRLAIDRLVLAPVGLARRLPDLAGLNILLAAPLNWLTIPRAMAPRPSSDRPHLEVDAATQLRAGSIGLS